MVPSHLPKHHFLPLLCLLVLLGSWSEEVYPKKQEAQQAPELREVNAQRISEPIKVDGVFDEVSWNQVGPARDFIQTEPNSGQPATEPTEVRILYDDKELYFGVRCFDSESPKGLTVNDVKKDFNTRDNDVFEVLIDSFNDDRNAFLFGTNPRGAWYDSQIANEGQSFNRDWDAVWRVAARITDEGWDVEIAIPFKTLRFDSQEIQVWGINFMRRVRRKSEDSYWSPIPRPFRITKVSLAGELHGLSDVQGGGSLFVTPYVVAPVLRREDDDVDFEPDAGLDIKYGLTSQLTLDATFNTDFSQVEADEERINLTRFSLFFPEKRDFFLENAGIFQFGPSLRGGGGGGGGHRPDMIPFFTRRIGIEEDQLVPIWAGARLTGRMGKYTVGALSMQTGDGDLTDEGETVPSTNFSVVRVRRDILSRSDVGGLFVNKLDTEGYWNRTYGVDSNLNFLNYLDIGSYFVKTQTKDLEGDDAAGQLRVSWDDDFWELSGSYLDIEEDFNPEVGFVPRTGIRKSTGRFGMTPRPGEKIPFVREFEPSYGIDYITDQEGKLETRESDVGFRTRFQDGAFLSFGYTQTFERLYEDFEIRDGQFIDAGDYNFNEFQAFYWSDRSRMLSGSARFSTGGFWDGDRTGTSLSVRFQPGYRFGMEGSWSHNNIDLPSGDFNTNLMSTRLQYSFSTRMFLNGLIQYNSSSAEVVSNIRFNTIYKPLSNLYLVYNERRSSTGEVIDWALIAKLTYMFSF